MALRRPMLTRVAGEKPRRPQFVGIAEVLGLAAGEVDNPCLGLGGDRRLPAGPRSIVERRHQAIDQRPLDAALDGLMVRAQGSPHRKERSVFPVGQQHPRSFDPARRFRTRAGNRAQRRRILLASRQFDRPPSTRHHLTPRFRIKSSKATNHVRKNESRAHVIGFNDSRTSSPAGSSDKERGNLQVGFARRRRASSRAQSAKLARRVELARRYMTANGRYLRRKADGRCRPQAVIAGATRESG